jgi:Asp-tRNA(Asn)/Glu-tRNA(Gln) amidotransferase A subunit family amidase
MRAGELRPAEVEELARRAIDQVNPDLNALTGPLFDEPLASDPGGPLAGVPFLIKDSGPFARGTGFTLGSRGIRGAVAADDHDLMVRFRAAGLVTLGQTTVPELCLNLATESVRYGPTRNPWNLDRGVGGSSGGAAALVAAGAVPLAHANDGGGSIRVPASCCGLLGLKPSRGRTPCGPLVGEAGFGQVAEFGLCRWPIGRFFLDHDLLVTPTLARPPEPHGTLDYDDPDHTVRSWLSRIYEYGPFTAAFNISGNPAVSVPLGLSRDGLPIGIQLVAAHGREDLLIRVAAQLEQAVPWQDHQPGIFVD